MSREAELERRFAERLLDSYERERTLLAYEIHDGMVQDVMGAQMRLQTLLATDQTLSEHVRRELEITLSLTRKSVEEARHLVRGLRPPMLEQRNVAAAVRQMIDELPTEGPAVDLHCEGSFDNLEDALETAVFRMVQEALTNARRHSQSERVAVRLARADQTIRLEIRDWGVGFDTRHVGPDSCGLAGMRQRSRLLGGETTIKSDPGEGTRVSVELPIVRAPGQSALDSYGSDE